MTKQYTLEDLQVIVESSAWLNEHEAKWLLDYAESLENRNADQAQVIAGLLQDKANFSLCQQASQPQPIAWQSPELAHETLGHHADVTGAVDQLLVSLDTKSPSYDGGPEYRQAWYCVMTRQFICLATNTALSNVTGWVSAK